MITITRKLEFDAGHRLMKHESKCRNVHGHRYVAEVECSAEALDSVGRIIDFSVIKSVLGGWIDEHWDHGFIYQRGDEIGDFIKEHSKTFELTVPPTAENMATYLLELSRSLMEKYSIMVVSIKLWETPNCWARTGF